MKNILQTLLILLISLQISFAQAFNFQNTVWVKNPQMSFEEFQSHIKLDTSYTSYAENKLSEAREQAKALSLKSKLIVAQELFLLGQEARATKAFKEMTDLSLSADWNKEDRRIILYSFLRLAQMEEIPEKRKALLLSASQFALFKIFPETYEDHDLFPPPLMEELKLIQEKSVLLSPDWKSIFPYHEIILINGNPIQQLKQTKLPQAFYRVSAFSSSHQTWSKKISLSNLISKTIKSQLLTEGPCNKKKLKAFAQQKVVEIAPFSNCPASFPSKFKKVDKQSDTSFISSFFETHKEKEFHSDIFNTEELFSEKSNKIMPAFLSDIPPWLLVGGGVVALGLIMSLSYNSQNSSKEVFIF